MNVFESDHVRTERQIRWSTTPNLASADKNLTIYIRNYYIRKKTENIGADKRQAKDKSD